MMRFTAAVLLALLGVLRPEPAHAQRMMGQAVTTHGYMGSIDLQTLYSFSDGTAVEHTDALFLGAQGGFGVTPLLSILANVGTNSSTLYLKEPGTTSLFGDAFSHEALFWDVSLQIRRPWWHEAKLNPFLQLGAGQLRRSTSPGSDPDRKDVRTSLAYNVGLGLDLQFGNNFAVRVMGKDYVTTGAWVNSVDPRFNARALETQSHNIAYHVGIVLGF